MEQTVVNESGKSLKDLGVGVLAEEKFKAGIGAEKQARVVRDYSGEKGYRQQFKEWEVEGTKIARLDEQWDGGSRTTRKVAGEATYVDLNSYGVGISTRVYENGEVSQETRGRMGMLRGNEWSPVVEGATGFFEAARRLDSDVVEHLRLNPDGGVAERELTASETKWKGQGDRYETTRVTYDGSKVRWGTVEHGIALGVVPEMHVIE